jgi:hypothetical protein
MKTKHTKAGNKTGSFLATLLLAMTLPAAASTIFYDSTAGGTSLGGSSEITNGLTPASYLGGIGFLGTSSAQLEQISFGLALSYGTYGGGTFTLSIFETTANEPNDGQSPVYTQNFTAALQTGTTTMFPVVLDTPYEIDANQKFLIALSMTPTDSNNNNYIRWSRSVAQDSASPLELQYNAFYTTDNGVTFQMTGAGPGNAITLSGSEISAVPEASTSLGLLALGAGGLLTRRRFILKA